MPACVWLTMTGKGGMGRITPSKGDEGKWLGIGNDPELSLLDSLELDDIPEYQHHQPHLG